MKRGIMNVALAVLLTCWLGARLARALSDVVDVGLEEGKRGQIVGKIIKESWKTVEIDYDDQGVTKHVSVPSEKVVDVRHGDLSPNFSLALQNLRAGDFEAAAKLFQTAYSEAPADSWARPYGLYYSAEAAFREAKYGQAEEAEKKKSYSVAEQQYSKLTAGFADHRFVPDAMLGRGIALMRLGRFDDAQSVFRSIAASEFPDKVKATARVWAARLLSEKGQHDAAIKALQEVRAAVMQKHPDIGWLAMLFEAYACQGKEDFRKAEELFEAVGLNSGQEELQAEAFNSRGRSLLKRGDQREALFSFLRVAVLYQAVTHEYQQALYYAAKTSKEYYGDDKRAKELAETLLLKFPNSYWARKLKAELPASPASGSGGG